MAIVLAPEHVTACIVAINMFPEARRRAEHFQKRVVRRASKGGPCWLCSFTKILGEDTIKVGYDLLAVKEFCARRVERRPPHHCSAATRPSGSTTWRRTIIVRACQGSLSVLNRSDGAVTTRYGYPSTHCHSKEPSRATANSV